MSQRRRSGEFPRDPARTSRSRSFVRMARTETSTSRGSSTRETKREREREFSRSQRMKPRIIVLLVSPLRQLDLARLQAPAARLAGCRPGSGTGNIYYKPTLVSRRWLLPRVVLRGVSRCEASAAFFMAKFRSGFSLGGFEDRKSLAISQSCRMIVSIFHSFLSFSVYLGPRGYKNGGIRPFTWSIKIYRATNSLRTLRLLSGATA